MEKPRHSIKELLVGETVQPEKIFQYERHVRSKLISNIDELEDFYTKK
jgi:protein associated with RNAse G/E